MYAEVIVDVSASEVDKIFDYECTDDIQAGCRVLVPFGTKKLEGFVIKIKPESDYDKSKIKAVISRLDDIVVIGDDLLRLVDLMKSKYNLKTVDILRLFIPAQMRGGRIKELKRFFIEINEKNPEILNSKLSNNQRDLLEYLQTVKKELLSRLACQFSTSAINSLVAKGFLLKYSDGVKRVPYVDISSTGIQDKINLIEQQKDAIDYIKSTDKVVVLLHGVTGSGKTEVYLNLINDAIKYGKTAIMLVPEIGLTPQTLRIFRNKFGDSVAILHSALSAGERFDEWKRLLLGDATVAIGARSAIFAPLTDIGIIIIDEEHDSSYISESNPRYDTKEIAKFRAISNNCKLVLGSATPNIETYHYVKTSEYGIIEMPFRINTRPLPSLQIVDMRKQVLAGNNSIISDVLLHAIDFTLKQNNKIMLFLNRRGYSSYVICKECGYVAKCTDCDVSLVYHKEENVLKCHFCQNRFAMLDICPECNSMHVRRGFVGTEQVVDTLTKHFPKDKILRMDNDTTQQKDSHLDILGKFASQDYNILVGTQMIVKGHDFASVALVGILDADMSLHFSDYRAVEKTFQLITQAAGRAGRATIEGQVILQSYTPSHYVYKFAASNDYKSFFNKEYNLREVTKYPPFCTVVRVLLSDEKEDVLQVILKELFFEINEISRVSGAFIYLACMRSPIKKIQKKYRMQILCRIKNDKLDGIINDVYALINKRKNTKTQIFVEINPSSLS